MKRILIMLWLALAAPVAFAIPTAPSVTFGTTADPNTLSATQFNKYDGSVFFNTSDGTANGVVNEVWHYSIKSNKFVKVPASSQHNLSAGVGIGITGSYPNQTISNTAPTVVQKVLLANFRISGIGRTNVLDWSFPVVAGKSYRVEIVATYQTAATTTGGSLGFILPTGAGTSFGFVEGDIINKTTATTLRQPIYAINATSTTAGSFITTTGVGVINSPHSMHSVITFNCTTSGTFQAQWATEVAASAAQLNAGSTLYVTEF